MCSAFHLGVERPRVCGAGVEEASFTFLCVTEVVRELARGEDTLPRLWAAADTHAVILLTAFAAEDERQQDATAVARDELLFVDGEIPFGFRLQGGIHRVATTDELMQAKGEHREPRLRVGLTGVATQELLRDGFSTARWRDPL